MHIVVIHIESGMPVYEGKFVALAARVLDPGTCYGWGKTPAAALNHAREQRQRFREMSWANA